MKQEYILQMLYRDNDGKLETLNIPTTSLSKTSAIKAGREYAKQNNMRCYQVFPKSKNAKD